MENENTLRIKGKLNYFLEKGILVHVKRFDKKFWRGVIIERESSDVFVMKEKHFGIVHLFAADVYDVEEYMEEGK
jgi:hypothetical protein